VVGGIDGDAVEPGIEGTVATEVLHGAVGLDESFLGYVLGLVGIAHEAAHQAQEAVLVTQHEQVEGAVVALQYPFHQLFVSRVVVRACQPGGSVVVLPDRTESAGSVPEPGQQQRPHSSRHCISSRIAPIHYRPHPPMSSSHSPDQRVQRADVLVIGGGAAGLSLALRLADHAHVVVLSKSSLRQGSTYYAQGGIAAVLDAADKIGRASWR